MAQPVDADYFLTHTADSDVPLALARLKEAGRMPTACYKCNAPYTTPVRATFSLLVARDDKQRRTLVLHCPCGGTLGFVLS